MKDWYSDIVEEIKYKLSTLGLFDQLFINQENQNPIACSLFEKSKFYVAQTGKPSSEMYLSLSEYNTSFTGKIGETDFAYIDSNPMSYGYTGKYAESCFSGVFFFTRMLKNLNSNRIVIIPSLSKKIFGVSIASFFLKLHRSRGFFINTGHADFDRNFAVYTLDKDNAKKVLVTSILENILSFKKEMKKPFRISFLYNYFCVAIDEEKFLKTRAIPDRLFPTKNLSCQFRKNVEITPAQILELSQIVSLSKEVTTSINLNPNIDDSLGDEFNESVRTEFLKKILSKGFSSKSRVVLYRLLVGLILLVLLILTIAIDLYSVYFL